MIKKIIKKVTPSFLLDFYHYFLAMLGAFLYGFPSKDLIVIGITGTSGKTTVVEMASKILEEGGYKTASLSSIKFKIGEKEEENKLKMTMPGRMKIQKFLSRAKKSGCKYVVLEVTSEGIKQFRHKFINFKTAVLTNLTPEHIEAHGGFEKYKEAKIKLFKTAKNIHIINADDKNFQYFFKIPAKRKLLFSVQEKINRYDKAKLVKAENIENKEGRISFTVKGVIFNLTFSGLFNIYNALAAISIGLSCGISLEKSKKALEKIKKISGRMEIITKKPFTVIVDYAHTPEALKNIYQTIKNSQPKKSRIICVLGACGGGRDKWKRPELGKLALKYCNKIIITNEDPYNENPLDIIEQVSKGTNDQAEKILDRKEAIERALKIAREKDTVIVTGKGSEPLMCIAKGKKIPWDDRKIVKEWLEKMEK